MSSYMEMHGERLIENGYHIIPIKPNYKSPGRFIGGDWGEYPGWQKHCERDTKHFELDTWSRWPGCAIGLACGNVIGIDIDIFDDAAVAFELERLAREMLGDTSLVRIGNAPKRALYYRAAEPFKGRKMHPLEIYGTGSQMVIYAIHPDTGQPYDWPNETPLEVDISQLPEVTEARVMEWLNV